MDSSIPRLKNLKSTKSVAFQYSIVLNSASIVLNSKSKAVSSRFLFLSYRGANHIAPAY